MDDGRDDVIPAMSLDEGRDETSPVANKDGDSAQRCRCKEPSSALIVEFLTSSEGRKLLHSFHLEDLAHNEPVKERIGDIAVRAVYKANSEITEERVEELDAEMRYTTGKGLE